MMYYVLLYLICCTVLSVSMVKYISEDGRGLTGHDILRSVLVSLVPVVNLTIAVFLIHELLRDILSNSKISKILDKTYLIKESK